MTRSRPVAVAVAVAVLTLGACDGGDRPVTAPAVTSPSPQAQAAPAATRILTRLVGRTGAWQATMGRADDRGDVTIHFRCTGGGQLTVGTSHGGSGTNACDGGTKLFAVLGEAPPGIFTVTVEPDDDQRWSLLVARGEIEAGSEWPAGGPEIQPGG